MQAFALSIRSKKERLAGKWQALKIKNYWENLHINDCTIKTAPAKC
jgi:hypothetical protein